MFMRREGPRYLQQWLLFGGGKLLDVRDGQERSTVWTMVEESPGMQAAVGPTAMP